MKTNSNTKITVTYPDGKDTHTTTIGRLRRSLSLHGYSEERVMGIIESLRSTGFASSSLADYEIVKDKWETT